VSADLTALDLSALGPTHECVCGSGVFKALVSFDDYDIASWSLIGYCVVCDSKVTLPCPVDRTEG
jgi:hypothetical protein